jgi:hypothetical protein
MLLALIDYIRYRTKPGRFGNLRLGSLMQYAFRGSLPKGLVDRLQVGDLLFTQRLHSFSSWAVMYLTKSEFSHVALYAGTGRIVHATLAGVMEEPLEALISDDVLLIACNMRLNSVQQSTMLQASDRLRGCPFGWHLVRRKARRIILGRDSLYFRLSYILDFAIVLIVLDLPFYLFAEHIVLLWLLPAYVLVAMMNLVLARLWPLPLDVNTTKPIEIFMLARTAGADFHLNAGCS